MTEHEIPRIVHQMVEAAGVPPTYRMNSTMIYAQVIDQFTQDMAMRSLRPVNDIAMVAVAYDPGEANTNKALFPKDYPVIGIHFNDQLVGITGILFDGQSCEVHKAETRMAQFLLKAKPKYLRDD